ncbi:MAG: PSD1 and planctomycete cytochrome C domain-containing protein [Opitutaceae bacterium]|nr:PSD1 and planctomycete cytochrome C domain-containing protein [Opitutaceae bacterium]
MTRRFPTFGFIGRIALLLALAAPLARATTPVEAEQVFVQHVQPLFKAKCLPCHGEDEEKMKGGFDLRTRATMLEGGDSFTPAVVAGRPDESPLYLAVTRGHSDWEPMPPKENDRLLDDQIAHIRAWIAGGSPWPDTTAAKKIWTAYDQSGAEGVIVKTSGGLSEDWTNRRYRREDLWAYQPLRKPAVPTVAGAASDERVSPVDAFINARLAAEKIPAAPAADRRTLIRRATFDLTGLPATPEEIIVFLSDAASDEKAFARVVDRLLASPHYGEHWGRHWLDVTRYADSSGFANDFARGSTWRYRDYVVRAFNDDKPYDQFIREQIAGDEIVEARKSGGAINASTKTPDSELLIATGFLRMGPWELTGMEVAKVARQRFLDDVTDSVGQVFLAAPLQCARCHDHKFDPIPTRDYYGFQAVFGTTQLAERPADFLPNENTQGFEEKKYLQQREEHYRAILKRLDAKSIAAARVWYAEKKIDPSAFEQAIEETVGKKSGRRGREAGFAEVRSALMRKKIPEDQIPPKLLGFTPEDYGIERIARKGLERLKWDYDRYEPLAFSVYSGRTPELRTVTAPLRMPGAPTEEGELEQTCILTGGDPFAAGQKVAPGVLSAASALGDMEPARASVPSAITGRRLALAEWIASAENPITARVMANRIWGWHFDQGIAGNPNNFGTMGKKPTHPELLDWLAAQLVEGGWSIKAMHRLIMNSAAYRRATEHPDRKLLAERDPHGTSFAVFKPRRLTAEEFRDTMLAVSGELNRTPGGIPARPEMNREAALQPRQVMGTFAEAWQPSPKPEQRHRRSLYALKIRGQLDPFMEVFNTPNPELSCERRDASTVTPQVFALFNSEATMERALAFAARLQREAPGREAAITRAFQLAYGRTPAAAELEVCLKHHDQMLEQHRRLTFERTVALREVVREAVEENTGEKFKFVEPLEFAADFVPDLKLADAAPETRALAEVCLVLFNSNEFAYVY